MYNKSRKREGSHTYTTKNKEDEIMVPDTMFGSRCKKCGGYVDEAGICCVCHFDHYTAAENAAGKEVAEAAVVSAKKEVPDEKSPIIIDDIFLSIFYDQ